jgi:hypothetical protein
MGRSISFPPDAQVCFTVLADEDGDDFEWELECFVDQVIDAACAAFPSLYRCDSWRGREDHVLLRNAFADLGVSTLGDMVAIWIVERADSAYHDADYRHCRSGRAQQWLRVIAPRFNEMFGDYERLGTMSNGESVYRKIDR